MATIAAQTPEALYYTIDDWGLGYIDSRNLSAFLSKQQLRVSDEELAAVIRRIDVDGGGKIELAEWMEGVSPVEPFSKMLIRQRLSR